MAVGPASPAEEPPRPPAMQMQPLYPMLAADSFARDATVAWFRGEFAAANAIIDALCSHLAELGSGAGRSEYGPVFVAIHRRRLNWIPVLQMQEFYSIADVAAELKRAGDRRAAAEEEKEKVGEESAKVEGEERSESVGVEEVKQSKRLDGEKEEFSEKAIESGGNGSGGDFETVEVEDDAPATAGDITNSGSQELQPTPEELKICLDHQECEARLTQIKLTKGFKAKEAVEGHMVNVVKGLKLYEDIFTASELYRLNDFIDELCAAGRNGELPGETFILFDEQMLEKRIGLIQFGLPSFKHIEEDTTDGARSKIMPIPALLRDVIDHLVQWQLLPEYKRPNGCIINFFNKGERSRPFLKPPNLDQPVSTLFLSKSRVAFGHSLISDQDGSYKGGLMLSLKEGSLLVMRGKSADVARHAMCPSPNRRVAITFFRIHPNSNQDQIKLSTSNMALWQPGIRSPFTASNAGLYGYEAADMIPTLGILLSPVVMLAPTHPMWLSPKMIQPGGTGVFLPWPVKSRKPARCLPPRARKGRLLDLPSPAEMHGADCAASLGDTMTQTGVFLGNGCLMQPSRAF